MSRIRRGREFWTALVKEFEGDGAREGHQEFADRHGVRCDTFRRWLYLLRAETRGHRWRAAKRSRKATAIALPLIEVHPAQAADGRFEIELRGDILVRVPAMFDVDALRRLLGIFDDKLSA